MVPRLRKFNNDLEVLNTVLTDLISRARSSAEKADLEDLQNRNYDKARDFCTVKKQIMRLLQNRAIFAKLRTQSTKLNACIQSILIFFLISVRYCLYCCTVLLCIPCLYALIFSFFVDDESKHVL